jgi:hypothetical protein
VRIRLVMAQSVRESVRFAQVPHLRGVFGCDTTKVMPRTRHLQARPGPSHSLHVRVTDEEREALLRSAASRTLSDIVRARIQAGSAIEEAAALLRRQTLGLETTVPRSSDRLRAVSAALRDAAAVLRGAGPCDESLSDEIMSAANLITGATLHGSLPDPPVLAGLDRLLKALGIQYAVVRASEQMKG